MKKRFIWIVELFIWVLILALISSGIIFIKYNYRKNFNTYQIFLPDVDGLINGSPAKLMGIQVGYVNQIDIVGEDVYVKFIITEPNVKIPKGSSATVEFSGLGGSKSLEIYPPTKESLSSGKFLIIQKPKRIHESLGLLNDMYDKIIEIAYITSRFINKIGEIKQKGYNKVERTNSSNSFLDFSNNWIDKMQKRADKFNDSLEEVKEKRNGNRNKKNTLQVE